MSRRRTHGSAGVLVLLGNLVDFSGGDWRMVNQWARTAYAHCQQLTQLMDASHKSDESRLDQKLLFRGRCGKEQSLKSLHLEVKCQAEACYVLGKMWLSDGTKRR